MSERHHGASWPLIRMADICFGLICESLAGAHGRPRIP